jgi:hypothetical protein
MTNDKYTELAAKALTSKILGATILELYNENKWHPLDNNGTAFKLAILLELDIIMPTETNLNATCRTKDGTITSTCKTIFTDPFSGVRRAIVKTAAKLAQLNTITTVKTTMFIRDSINPETYSCNSYDLRV